MLDLLVGRVEVKRIACELGGMEVESLKIGGASFEGPNSLRANKNGSFSDDAFLGTQISSGSAQVTVTFICDKTYGTISQSPGSTGAGGTPADASVGAMSVMLATGNAEYISNPAESIVNVQFSGDAAVAGSLTTTATAGAYGVGIEFSREDDWGEHAGSFNTVSALTGRKGSD